MKEEQITEETIVTLINRFYAKVRTDAQLGPIFLQAIGDDDKTWAFHLRKMYDFWSSVMLASGRYHGNPFQKHLVLPSFDNKLFDRWLSLFEETAREIHPHKIATLYIEKSQRIAQSLKLGLSYHQQKDL